MSITRELPGISARLDRLVYHRGGSSLPVDSPHAFVYFITIYNGSPLSIELLGRKWLVTQVDGERIIIEGDKIVGETPHLEPGESFSYNSYHITGCDARVTGSFLGKDENGELFHVLLAPFDMIIPPAED